MDPINQDSGGTEPTVVSSAKKGLSSKQKLYGGIASVIALVGIGFGGLALWQNLSSNAAGEDSLGNTTSVDLPTESPYFKITAFDQQNVALEAMGDARTQSSDGNDTRLQTGWRIERTTLPDDAATWKIATASGDPAQSNNAEGRPAGAYDRDSIVIDRDNPGCGFCWTGDGLAARMSDTTRLQAETIYFYRAAKLAEDGVTWEPQGPNIQVKTLAYPSTTISKVNGDLVAFNWTESHPEGAGLSRSTLSGYTLVRSSDPNLLKKYQNNGGNYQQLLPSAIRNEVYNNPDKRLRAGDSMVAQPKNTTYYYVMAREWSGTVTPVGTPVAVTTGALQTSGLISANLSATTAPWTQQTGIKATITQLAPGKVDYSQYFLSNAQGTSSGICNSWTTSGAITAIVTTMPVCNKTPLNFNASKVTTSVKATAYTVAGNIEQTVSLPFTLTKINNAMTAAYPKNPADAINGAAYVNINVRVPIAGGRYPQGTYAVKNRSTGKTLATMRQNLVNGTSVQTFQLRPLLAPGKYYLALVYTESGSPYFNNKTINLPLLTVTK